MIRISGIVTRPKGSSSTGPASGSIVPWRLATPILNLATQAEKLEWPILGIVGNTDHLKKYGDHTPWSKGKVQGVIYAIDVAPPNDFEAWLVALCRSPHDTQWIDFFNINGRQYSNAGVKVATSGDKHLHISVAKGYENYSVTLFSDYAKGDDDMPSAEEVASAVWGKPLSSPTLDDGKPHNAHEGVINAIIANRRLKAIEDRLTALERGDATGAPGEVSADAIATAVVSKIASALAGKGV